MEVHDAKLPAGVALSQPMTWDDWRVFAVLAQSASMRQAAQHLGLNVSTVSRRLSALEEALGVRLFARHPEGLKLTPAGVEAQRFTDGVGAQLSELHRRIAGRDHSLSGVVRVATAEAMAALVAEALGAVAVSYPEIELSLIVSDAMVSLERNEAELVVRAAESPPEHWVGRRLGTAAVALYASRSYVERNAESLRSGEYAWVEWPSYVHEKRAFKWLEAEFPGRKVALRANSSQAVLQAVRSGVGVAPLACVHAADEASLVRLQRLPEDCGTSVWLLAHTDLRATTRVSAVMDVLAERLLQRRQSFSGEY